MKLKIPPVGLVIITAGLMWGVNKLISISYSFAELQWVSKGLFALCIIVLLFALAAFKKLKTTVDPMHPEKASKLVTVGIYHLTRNPMYLSMLLLLAGFAVKLGNPICVLPLVIFVWYMNQFQIKPEEEALRKIFGEDFNSYCRKVRRWI